MRRQIQVPCIAALLSGVELTVSEIRSTLGDDNVSHAAVFLTMHRLSQQGFVSFRQTESRPMKGGRKQNLYKITKSGCDAFSEMQKANANLIQMVGPKVFAGI